MSSCFPVSIPRVIVPTDNGFMNNNNYPLQKTVSCKKYDSLVIVVDDLAQLPSHPGDIIFRKPPYRQFIVAHQAPGLW